MITRQGIFRISVATIIISFNLSFISAQEEIGKEVHETYEVKSGTSLSIDNKYGNIDVQNWDKKNIDVKVQVKLFDVDESKASELLKMIDIKYYTEGDKIIFKTEYDESFSKSLMRINNGDKKFEVNYIVNMPHTVPVDILNRYGNVFIDRISSASKFTVKYGKLKANNISSLSKEPITEVYLAYSEGNIEECGWLKINIKYSKLKIDESKALIVLSKYSKIYINRGSSVVSESKYDTYEIGTIANLVGEAGYSNFKIKSTGKKLKLDTKYTDVIVGYMPASFEIVKIINLYGGYKIGIEDGASYLLKGIGKYGSIIYPENSRVNRFQESTEIKVEGKVGEDSEPKSKVYIDTKYGTVNLKN